MLFSPIKSAEFHCIYAILSMGKNPDVAAAGIEPWRHLMSQRGAPLHLKNISCVNGNSSKVVKRIRRKVIFPVKESTGNWTNSSLSLFCGRPAARPFLLPSAIVSFPTSDCTWREKHKFSSFFFSFSIFHFEKKKESKISFFQWRNIFFWRNVS